MLMDVIFCVYAEYEPDVVFDKNAIFFCSNFIFIFLNLHSSVYKKARFYCFLFESRASDQYV